MGHPLAHRHAAFAVLDFLAPQQRAGWKTPLKTPAEFRPRANDLIGFRHPVGAGVAHEVGGRSLFQRIFAWVAIIRLRDFREKPRMLPRLPVAAQNSAFRWQCTSDPPRHISTRQTAWTCKAMTEYGHETSPAPKRRRLRRSPLQAQVYAAGLDSCRRILCGRRNRTRGEVFGIHRAPSEELTMARIAALSGSGSFAQDATTLVSSGQTASGICARPCV